MGREVCKDNRIRLHQLPECRQLGACLLSVDAGHAGQTILIKLGQAFTNIPSSDNFEACIFT